jgi:hypothetical protein
MSKRGSGAPRHPRNPVAKAVRTPTFKMRVVPDKRRLSKLEDVAKRSAADSEAEEKLDVPDQSED